MGVTTDLPPSSHVVRHLPPSTRDCVDGPPRCEGYIKRGSDHAEECIVTKELFDSPSVGICGGVSSLSIPTLM